MLKWRAAIPSVHCLSTKICVAGYSGLYNIGYPSKMHVKPTSSEFSLAHNLSLSYQIVWTFCKEHGSDATMPCVKGEMIGQIKLVLWINEISRDSSLRCVSDGYHILQAPPPPLVLNIWGTYAWLVNQWCYWWCGYNASVPKYVSVINDKKKSVKTVSVSHSGYLLAAYQYQYIMYTQ